MNEVSRIYRVTRFSNEINYLTVCVYVPDAVFEFEKTCCLLDTPLLIRLSLSRNPYLVGTQPCHNNGFV